MQHSFGTRFHYGVNLRSSEGQINKIEIYINFQLKLGKVKGLICSYKGANLINSQTEIY